MAAQATVGCARVITDGVTVAWVADVIVDARQRGQVLGLGLGLGTWMVEENVNDWWGARVRRAMLATGDDHEVYARFGCRPLAHPERMKEINRRPSC